jgi:hypothetical protein
MYAGVGQRSMKREGMAAERTKQAASYKLASAAQPVATTYKLKVDLLLWIFATRFELAQLAIRSEV